MKDEKGNPVIQSEIHKEINWHIDECMRTGYYALILAPVGHGKTEEVAIARPLMQIGKDVNARISIICNTDENGAGRISSISKYIEEDINYRKTFPNVIPNGKWTGHQLFVKRQSRSKDPSIQSWGIMSSGTGSRIDLAIFDDVCDMKNTIVNEADRPKVKQYFKDVWMTRIRDGFAIYIATAMHQDDLTHELMKNARWKKLNIAISDDMTYLKCESDFRGSYKIPLCSFYPKPLLIKKHEELGSLAFNRAFRQQAISDASRKFPHFDKCLNPELALTDVLIGGNRYVTGVDLSSESRPGNVIFTIGITQQNKKVPIDIRYGDWSSPDTAKQIREVENKYKPLVIMVENNAYQDSIIQWIKELKGEYTFWNKIKGFCTGKQKADHAIGLPSLDVEFENGSWLIPTKGHEADCQCGVCKWMAEMKTYPFGKYSDGVMASWFAREGARLFASEPFTKKELDAIYGNTPASDDTDDDNIETTDDLMRHIA